MPLRFRSYKGTYADNETGLPLFSCLVDRTDTRFCKRCVARKGQTYENLSLDGVRCKNKTCYISDFCAVHLKTIMNLELKPSHILREMGLSGIGLFAYGPGYEGPIFHRGRKHIAFYGGESLNKVELGNRYDYKVQGEMVEPTAPYALTIGDDLVLDAACSRKAAVYTNSAHNNSEHEFNAMLVKCHHTPSNTRLILIDGKEILHGDEILTSYSYDQDGEEIDDYWEGLNDMFMTFNTKYESIDDKHNY